ncbi:endonuclease/exonuclease/phosphatase family protein [Dactylosporangium sp. CA-152071]|uniref:endonuclease/exonuclease/phosphatase family protein n=1 Tax=Dactylosporangium sp. CA-152071 TaxID=3239933 RepID=UPI003D8B793D
MHIRVVAQNLGNGGLRDSEGNPEDRWPALAERLRTAQPDVLLLNEARGWTEHGHRQLGRAQRDLGMYAAPLPPSKTGMRTAILFRPDTLGWWTHTNDAVSQETTHGFVIAAFPIPGLPAPITFAAAHLDPYLGDKALYEAKLIATAAYRYGPYAVIGGDMNFPPEDGPDPDYDQMRPYNLAARTLLTDPGTALRPDRRAAQMLHKCGYLDAALHLHRRTSDAQLLRRTGSDDRIDRIHLSSAFGDAISNYQLLDLPAGASDHHGVAVDIDTDAIDRNTLWTYR